MKPAAFEYHAPDSLADALALLAEYGEEGRPLAGGQSLVPLMNFRLARPEHLVDLNRVAELTFLETTENALRIGAMTRQRQLERSAPVRSGWPLLSGAARYIGHVQIRNRGTIGGSLAHAFPSAELPVAMVALEAEFVLRSASGERTVAAEDFFVATMSTLLEPGELLSEIRVPRQPPASGWAFQEVSRRHGDFALAGVAAMVTLTPSGMINRTRLTLTGMTPIRAKNAEDATLGERPSEALFREAAERATAGLEQDSDIHASAEYRRQVCGVLVRRALADAAQRASAIARDGTL